MDIQNLFATLIYGAVHLHWWGYILLALVLTHITTISVTIYLHRYSAHRALDLHPILAHFFRFWLWLTTGMVTKAWTAIHRKHHVKCDRHGDPHSPHISGIWTVFFEGAELYKKESLNDSTIKKYGHGTPNDWLERNLYTPFSTLGISSMFLINLLLFGPLGISIWAVQMLWIPLTAAGIVNGFGHYCGYRNFQTGDKSTNILPWGIIIGGEELHNNHHAYATSARLSSKWYEFDIGWMYVCIFASLKLAKIKNIAPRVNVGPTKNKCDLETLKSVITHRYEVLSRFTNSIKKIFDDEIQRLLEGGVKNIINWRQFKTWLHNDLTQFEEQELQIFYQLLNKSPILKNIYLMRAELSDLWDQSNLSRDQLLLKLEDWCQKADQTGIVQLENFSRTLRSYN